MRRLSIAHALVLLILAGAARGQTVLEPIHTVAVGDNSELRVNGKPFLPLMLWLQVSRDFPRQRELGCNVIAGYSGAADQLDEYATDVWKAGMYFVPSLARPAGSEAQKIAGSEGLLGWIQGDEPDMPITVSDAEVAPGPSMRVNAKTPFSRLVDGDTSSWTALEPVVGGEFTIHRKQPVTAHALTVWQTISTGLAVAKEVTFLGDGREILSVTLENRKGQQKFGLARPETFQALTVRIRSVHAGSGGFGSISEVEALDESGQNVLLARFWSEPRTTEAELAAAFEAARKLDPQRPVFMTFTAYFMRKDNSKYDEAKRASIYPRYAKYCDILGFDTYPIYGTGTPARLLDVAEGVTQLRAIAGPGKPTYAWIETNKGSRWMTYSKQPEVLPEHTRFEVWMAIIRGAKGIAYFTHRWQPDYKQFAPEEPMQQEMQRLNRQLTRLAPAILAAPSRRVIDMAIAGGLTGHWLATEHEGALYLFAQNLDLGEGVERLRQFDPIHPRAGRATFRMDDLEAGTEIEVVDERRTIIAEAGQFTDEFSPLGEHIYRIPAPGSR